MLIESSLPLQAEYQAVLNKAISLGYTLPSIAQQEKDNKKVFYFKQEGIWSNLELFYNFKTEAGLENFTKLNWINPNTFALTSTNYPTLTANVGYTSNGLSHLNTNWISATHAVKCLPTNASVFFGLGNTPAGQYFGCRNTSANNFGASSGAFQLYGSSSPGDSNPGSGVVGHNYHTKTGLVHKRYENGIFVSTFTYPNSRGTQTVPMVLMAWNLGGTIAQSMASGGILEYWGNGNNGTEAKQSEIDKIMRQIAPFN